MSITRTLTLSILRLHQVSVTQKGGPIASQPPKQCAPLVNAPSVKVTQAHWRLSPRTKGKWRKKVPDGVSSSAHTIGGMVRVSSNQRTTRDMPPRYWTNPASLAVFLAAIRVFSCLSAAVVKTADMKASTWPHCDRCISCSWSRVMFKHEEAEGDYIICAREFDRHFF